MTYTKPDGPNPTVSSRFNETSALRLQCANPTCLHPSTPLGRRVCDKCQQPLVYRYLWAVGEMAAQLAPGTWVNQRYVVKSPQVWLDTQPAERPQVPVDVPPATLPYLRLYGQRLHLPSLYGFCALEDGSASGLTPIPLLDNGPIDGMGQLHPTLDAAWVNAPPTRQVYWLWQMFDLWQALHEQGVATSLLVPENLRVDGWRVHLRELITDPTPPPLKALAEVWSIWLRDAHSSIVAALQRLCQVLAIADDPQPIADSLNHLLLTQAAQLPLTLTVAGATTTGPQRSHNEDSCYPSQPFRPGDPYGGLLPSVAIICDGIGGHEGGEVASQLALRSLTLQLRAFLGELTHQTEPLPPAVIEQQLLAMVRIANNVIAERNNGQGRELRQRMGTTLVMALQVPRQGALGNTHELYLVHVGDSRAYWITPHYCHALTVDDDVSTREVRAGRSLYSEASHRSDAEALTQALGTRDGELLAPTVQRFILEEEGLLLLCSDGLSDGDRVEQSWLPITRAVLTEQMSLEEAVQAWIELANEKNGHDNTSVVLMRCQLVTDGFVLEPEAPLFEPDAEPEVALTESSKALLYDDYEPDSEPPGTSDPASAPAPRPRSGWRLGPILLSTALIMFVVGVLGIVLWRQLDPIGFRTLQQRLWPSSSPEGLVNPN